MGIGIVQCGVDDVRRCYTVPQMGRRYIQYGTGLHSIRLVDHGNKTSCPIARY